MDESKDFFISYTGADVAWAEWIAQTLEGAGYKTILQAWDFRPGDNFIERMNQALTEAERVLAVLSAAYFASDYARDEWTAALVRDRGERDRLLPVRVVPCELPDLIANRIYVDLVGLDQLAAAERLLAGVQPGRAKPARLMRFPGTDATSFPGHWPAIFDVPPRNPHFTGRNELLDILHRRLSKTGAAAVVQAWTVYGLGGVGKTSAAVEYAHRYAADYDVVWWIRAERPVTITERLAQLGRRLGLPELPSLEEQVGVVFDALGQQDRWLLVYDNADQPADLQGLRPPAGGGHVLITSRNHAWSGIGVTVPVDVLPRDQAVGFLAQRTGSSDHATLGRLADVLGDLPLGLEQAAAYLEETGSTLDEYLGLLGARAPELFALGQPATTTETIATTWTVSLDHVRAQAPAAEDLLSLSAFLASDDLPRSLLTDHADVLPGQLAAAMGDRLASQQVIGALRRYSLATVTPDAMSVHRLVQAIVRQTLDPEHIGMWAATAVRLLQAAFPNQADDVGAWPAAARLLPHAMAVTEHAGALGADPRATAGLLDEVGRYLRGRAAFRQAKNLHERALSIREAHLDPNDPDTAYSHSNLGLVLWKLDELDAARIHHQRALAIRETHFGIDDLSIVPALNNLANVLHHQDDLAGARALLERALAIHETRLGVDHLDTATSLNNLAGVAHSQGDLAFARTLYERALTIFETRLGADHPNTATSLNNLAGVLRAQDDLAGARILHERALKIREARLGPDHPDTALSLHNLAGIRRDQGDLRAARDLYEQALAVFQARLGADHPFTAYSRRGLAGVNAALKDWR